MTNGELVSRIVNDARLLNRDEHISRRHVLRIAQSKSAFLLAQKLMDKTLFRDTGLISTIYCFELEKVEIVRCDIVEFRMCKTLYKSKEKLPKLIYSRYGSSIIDVRTVDGSQTFYPITPRNYAQYSKRPNANLLGKKFYYVRDGYLYLPEGFAVVDIDLITTEPEKVDELSSCGNCDGCKSVWDFEFTCTDKLEEIVIQETLQEILGSYRQIIPDENPNKDEHLKSKTTL